jgi:hypothetical protein
MAAAMAATKAGREAVFAAASATMKVATPSTSILPLASPMMNKAGQ